MKNYRSILIISFNIVKKYKFLWFLGVFVSLITARPLISMFQSLVEFVVDKEESIWTYIRSLPSQIGQVIENSKIVYSHDPKYFLIAFGILIVFFIISLIIFWIGIVSQIGLFHGAYLALNKKKATLKLSFSKGISCFWRAVGIYIISFAVLLILFIILSEPSTLMMSQNIVIHYLFSGLFLTVYVLAFFIVTMITIFSFLILTRDNLGIIDSIARGYKLFIQNWLSTLEMFFVTGVLKVVAAFLGMMLLLLVELPFILLQFIFKWTGAALFSNIAYSLTLGLFFLFFACYVGFIVALEFSIWTVFFESISKHSFTGKFKRLLYKFKK